MAKFEVAIKTFGYKDQKLSILKEKIMNLTKFDIDHASISPFKTNLSEAVAV